MKKDDPVPELRVVPDRFLPHRYAGASGDFNPIHVDPASAKALGQPQQHPPRALHDERDGQGRRRRRGRRSATAQAAGRPVQGAGFPEKELSAEGRVREVKRSVGQVEAKLVQDGGDVVVGEAEVSSAS